MIYIMWKLIPKYNFFTIIFIYYFLYMGAPMLFSIELRHGGKFTKLPKIKYTRGEICYVELMDINEFSVYDLDVIMLELGYPTP